MEARGRIVRVLAMRKGVSAKTGNEWKALPFVFEYFENQTDRYPDSVLLETFDTKEMETIGRAIEKDAEGKAVLKDGEYKMSCAVLAKCAFGLRAKQYNGQNGTRWYNEVRKYRIEFGEGTQAEDAPVQPERKHITRPEDAVLPEHIGELKENVRAMVKNGEEPEQENDELPF